MSEFREYEITSGITSRRIHEVALQHWLNQAFKLKEGFPVPVVFATPMDAFAEYERLWSREDNPFAYLYDLKDSNNTPIYQPYPSPVRLPLINVKRAGASYRAKQSYGTRDDRMAYYRSASKNIKRDDIAIAVSRKMPHAWDYRYQVTHMCTRPDTQAVFEHNLVRAWRSAASEPQTFIPIVYPQHHGLSMVRVYSDGNIDNTSPDPQADEQTMYWTSFSLTIEGWVVDIDEKLEDVLWSKVTRIGTAIPPEGINLLYAEYLDMRRDENNSVFRTKPNLP